MRCPVCSTILHRHYYKGLFLDICMKCKGIWVDKEEFKLFIKSFVMNPAIEPEKIKLFEKKNVINIYKAQEPQKLCPKCSILMGTFNYACDSNIFINKCPNCEGFWLDKDEHIRIAQYLKSNPSLERLGKSFLEEKENIRKFQETINDLQDVMSSSRAFAFWRYRGVFFLLPKKDTTPITITPVITYLILFINLLTFIYMFVINKGEGIEIIFSRYGFIPAYAWTNLWRWITHLFLHVSITHLFINMWFFFIFADNVEDKLGHIKFILFYLICGVLSNIIYPLFGIYNDKTIIQKLPHFQIPLL